MSAFFSIAVLLPTLAAAIRGQTEINSGKASAAHFRELAAFGEDLQSWFKAVEANAQVAEASEAALLEVEAEENSTAGTKLPKNWPAKWSDKVSAPKAIGKGAFGKVYLAKACGGTDVAVKEMVAKSKEDLAEVKAEADMLRLFSQGGELASPHFVQFFDHAKGTGKASYIMMEAAMGGTLQKATSVSVATQQRTLLGEDMIEGIAQMHDAGLIHRDLKPANVLVSTKCVGAWDPKKACRAKVADLGMSCWLQKKVPGAPKCRGVGGTPLYMAPELYKTSTIHPANDVWALGLMLYELNFNDLPAKITRSRTMNDLERNIKSFKMTEDPLFARMTDSKEKQLIKMMMHPDYTQRITAKDALTRIKELAPSDAPGTDVMASVPPCFGKGNNEPEPEPPVKPVVPVPVKPDEPGPEPPVDDEDDENDEVKWASNQDDGDDEGEMGFFTVKSPKTKVSVNFIFKDDFVDVVTGEVKPAWLKNDYLPKIVKPKDVILTVNDKPWASLTKDNNLLREQMKDGVFRDLTFAFRKNAGR